MNFSILLNSVIFFFLLFKFTDASDCSHLKSAFSKIQHEYSWLKHINDCCDESEYFICDKNKNVVEINLNSVKLDIELSKSIGSLSSLQKLDLGNTGLIGSIPKEIYNLSNLEKLELNNNKLNGTFSEDIQNLKKLQKLNLKDNNISGEIPNSISQIKGLEFIDLSKNNFTGVIPLKKQINFCSFEDNNEELCSLTKLKCNNETITICDEAQNANKNNENKEPNDDEESSNTTIYIVIGIVAAVLIISIIIYVIVKNSNKKSGEKILNNGEEEEGKGEVEEDKEKLNKETPNTDDNENCVINVEMNEANETTNGNENKENTFVLPDLDQSVKNDLVDDLLVTNPLLIQRFVSIDRIKSYNRKSREPFQNQSTPLKNNTEEEDDEEEDENEQVEEEVNKNENENENENKFEIENENEKKIEIEIEKEKKEVEENITKMLNNIYDNNKIENATKLNISHTIEE